ncbi:MAG: hypothetical protein ACE5EX_11885 [Phycisphaerae bacterium]
MPVESEDVTADVRPMQGRPSRTDDQSDLEKTVSGKTVHRGQRGRGRTAVTLARDGVTVVVNYRNGAERTAGGMAMQEVLGRCACFLG